MHPVIKSLARHARRWGGRIVEYSDAEYRRVKHQFGWSEAPFHPGNLGVNWPGKVIGIAAGAIDWPAVIHEMGHVFASRLKPDRSAEWEFLGWEIVLARQYDLPFYRRCNHDYGIEWSWNGNHYPTIGDLSDSAWAAFCEEHIALAKGDGLINRHGKPVAIR